MFLHLIQAMKTFSPQKSVVLFAWGIGFDVLKDIIDSFTNS